MSVDLINASRQWGSRPLDQRFATLKDMKIAIQDRKDISIEDIISVKSLSIKGKNAELHLQTDSKGKQNFTPWSFEQLCRMTGAPVQYMRSIPSDLVATNLEYSLRHKVGDGKVKVLSLNGKDEIRSFNSQTYGRIWDIDVVKSIEALVDSNAAWHNPPARSVTINGKVCHNAGLYASDRDVFMFFVDDKHLIDVGKEKLARGFFIWNSEVGKTSFGLTTFLYRFVCGNHIVWGAQEINEIRIRHTENSLINAFMNLYPAIQTYMESSPKKEIEMIKKAQDFIPAVGKEKIGEWLVKRGFPKELSNQMFERVEAEEKTDKPSLWNIVNGLTAIARDMKNVDGRVEQERRIGELLNMN